jgi:4-carboxymuconolactone decarboxylase
VFTKVNESKEGQLFECEICGNVVVVQVVGGGELVCCGQKMTLNEMVMKLEGHIWDDGALTKKTKKLIAIAIAASMRDQHATRAQLAGAANLGVTKAEIEEALRVTFLLAGMPAYVYGKAQLDEIIKE